MNRLCTVIAAIAVSISLSFAPTADPALDYIAQHKEMALDEMTRAGIPASIKLAQAIIETNSGSSILARRANNHFGIKCKSYWEGKRYFYTDDDRDGQGNLIPSCFRMYDSTKDSFTDHSDFLVMSDRYDRLFEYDVTDYKSWAQGLQECGYATDRSYGERLIKTIERYDLHTLDTAVTGRDKN